MPTMSHPWTFLTNHAHVLILLARDPGVRIRDIADQVGITERAVQRILAELIEASVITSKRVGRRNHYEVNANQPLRHPIEGHRRVGDLLRVILTEPDRAVVQPAPPT